MTQRNEGRAQALEVEYLEEVNEKLENLEEMLIKVVKGYREINFTGDSLSFLEVKRANLAHMLYIQLCDALDIGCDVGDILVNTKYQTN